MVLLDVNDIHTYYGESYILHGVSITVGESEIVSILGRNGAGKTTSVRSIMGLTPPQRGTIKFQGDNITELQPEKISKKGISLVGENRDIFPNLSVKQNLHLGSYAHDTPEERIDDVYKYFPRLKERKDQPGGQLSGGEQQMLAIGRGLMTDPKLLILDEPTEGLAPVIVKRLVDAIKEINDEGVTILIIEQNVNVALELASQFYIMETGKIMFNGSKDEILEKSDLLEEIVGVKMESE